MRKLFLGAMIAGLAMMVGDATPAAAQMQMQMADAEEVELTGQVVDISCKQVYNLSGDDHRECAQVCADNGIPLGIFANGTMYVPVTDGMPGQGANEMLRPHAEHTVNVKGKVVDRAGMKGIIIEDLSM